MEHALFEMGYLLYLQYLLSCIWLFIYFLLRLSMHSSSLNKTLKATLCLK
jgi:hypothetical protein